jgi:hypothetical protein
MGVFGGVTGAKYSEGGVYLVPGVFRLKVVICKHIKTGAHTGSKDAFVAEFEVLESNAPQLPPGTLVSWMAMLHHTPAMGNIKNFLGAAIPEHVEKGIEIDESVAEYAVNEAANPLADRIVRCSAVNTKTKAGRDFTKCKFFADADSAGATDDQKAA